MCDKKIEGIEKKFSEFEEKNKEQQNEFNELKNDFLKLKEEYQELVKIVLENKQQIDSLYGKLNETIQNYKDGDENLKKKLDNLKKVMDDKLLELNTKIELILNNINGGMGGTGDKKFDLSGLDDFMQKLVTLENKFEDFVTKANIDEIYKQLKYLNDNKADKFDLDQVKEVLNELNKKSQEHQDQIEVINRRLDSLSQEIVNNKGPINTKEENKKNDTKNKKEEKEKKHVKYSIDLDSLDLSKYAIKKDLDNYIKENNEEIKKISEEIRKIDDLINGLTNILKDKADTEDLNELRDFILSKIDELINDFNKKFAEKSDVLKSIKHLEEQIKKLYSLIKSKKDIHTMHDADNWLLAKKPINGFSCVACESYLGDLKTDKNKYIPWNKLPVRDPGDKLYRMGNGFSKMLNMLNFDDNGNVSLNRNYTNSDDSESKNDSNDKVINPNINVNELKQKKLKSNNTKTLLKNRFQSASTSLIKENKDNKEYNNIKLGHKTQNLFFNKEEIKNKYLPKLKKEMSVDALQRIKEEKPKITKVIKKNNKKYHIKESN